MGEQTVLTPEQEAYNQRVQRVETAGAPMNWQAPR